MKTFRTPNTTLSSRSISSGIKATPNKHYVYGHYTNDGQLGYIGSGTLTRAFDYKERHTEWLEHFKEGGYTVLLHQANTKAEATHVEGVLMYYFNPATNQNRLGGKATRSEYPYIKEARKQVEKGARFPLCLETHYVYAHTNLRHEIQYIGIGGLQRATSKACRHPQWTKALSDEVYLVVILKQSKDRAYVEQMEREIVSRCLPPLNRVVYEQTRSKWIEAELKDGISTLKNNTLINIDTLETFNGLDDLTDRCPSMRRYSKELITNTLCGNKARGGTTKDLRILKDGCYLEPVPPKALVDIFRPDDACLTVEEAESVLGVANYTLRDALCYSSNSLPSLELLAEAVGTFYLASTGEKVQDGFIYRSL